MLARTLPGLAGEHVVASLTNHDFWSRDLARAGIKVVFLGLTRWNLPVVTWRLRRLIKQERPDIINTYLLHANLYGRFLGKLSGAKVICSVRNIHRDRKLYNLLDRLSQGLVDIYTPNSRAVAEFLTEELKIPRRKVVVIPNGINVEAYEKAEKRGVRARRPLFLCVASFKKQKDHETLVRAFAQIAKGTLLLVGEGVEERRIRELVQQLGIEKRVRFLGVQKDVPGLLKTADFLVLPSRHEGMPNILLEAMAAKTPIICSDIMENKELVGKDATRFTAGDVEALTHALKTAKRDAKRLAQLYKRVNDYSIERTRKKLEQLYARL